MSETFDRLPLLAERLDRRHDTTPDGCHRWTGAHDKFGFGRMHTSAGVRSVHRVAWVVKNGPVPDGKFVQHSCKCRDCVNPEHLYLADPPETK